MSISKDGSDYLWIITFDTYIIIIKARDLLNLDTYIKARVM